MKKHEEEALELFYKGYNCAQAVVGSFADKMNLTQEDALRISEKYASGTYIASGPFLAISIVLNYAENRKASRNPLKLSPEIKRKGEKLKENYKKSLGTTTCRGTRLMKTNNIDNRYQIDGCNRCIQEAVRQLDDFFSSEQDLSNLKTDFITAY